MQRRIRTLTDQRKTFSASGKSVISIPTDAYLQDVQLRLALQYDTGASATVAEDAILRVIKQINLRVNGKVKRSWAPQRYWPLHVLDYKTRPERVDLTTTQANDKTASVVLHVPFRGDVQDDDDFGFMLPARYLSNVDLEIEWGPGTDLGTAQTVDAAQTQVEATLSEVVLDGTEELALYGAVGPNVIRAGSRLLEIIESEQTKTVDAAYTNYQFAVDLPSGAVLARSALYATKAGARSDALVEQYRVRQTSPVRVDYVEESWTSSQARDKTEYQIQTAIDGNVFLKGLTLLDYIQMTGAGLDLTGRKAGDVRLEADVSAPSGTTNVVLLHQQVAPVAY